MMQTFGFASGNESKRCNRDLGASQASVTSWTNVFPRFKRPEARTLIEFGEFPLPVISELIPSEENSIRLR